MIRSGSADTTGAGEITLTGREASVEVVLFRSAADAVGVLLLDAGDLTAERAEPARAADAAVGASKVERFATAELLR